MTSRELAHGSPSTLGSFTHARSARKGFLFAISIFALLLNIPFTAAQGFSVIYSFTGQTDGRFPNGDLIQDAAGNLYGTTQTGGAFGLGIVFKLDPAGNLTTLYAFTGGNDGSAPYAGLFRDADGSLYGTTREGSAASFGTVFKLDGNGVFTTLHAFQGSPNDGAFPTTRLISINGVLYGVTGNGGNPNCDCGVIFKLTKSGKETVLYTFSGMADGSYPESLIRDSAGNLYGNAFDNVNIDLGGTIFELNTAGTFTVIHTFSGLNGAAGGDELLGRLIRDSNGVFHGTTLGGGDLRCNCGVVYRIDASGNEAVAHKFFGGKGGAAPRAGVVDLHGALYGTTAAGGDPLCACGVLFKISNTGQYSVLHRFTGGADGASPYDARLSVGRDGNIYGATPTGGLATGGPFGGGVIFKYTP